MNTTNQKVKTSEEFAKLTDIQKAFYYAYNEGAKNERKKLGLDNTK